MRMFSSFFSFLKNSPKLLKLNNKKMTQLFISFPILFLFLIPRTTISAQAPAAAPAPTRPTNVTALLEKDGRFTIFIHLLQSTKVVDNLNSELNDTNSDLTIFAPTDGAFSNLKTGMLNSLTDEQKVELMQFHILPSYLPPSQFQTASNPLRTQAGSDTELFSMNVTAVGDQVNITTGETNATVVHTIYTDNQLAVYEVDKVLLPLRFYVPMPPPPPPPPKKPAPKVKPAFVEAVNSSSAKCLSKVVLHAMACFILVLAIFPW